MEEDVEAEANSMPMVVVARDHVDLAEDEAVSEVKEARNLSATSESIEKDIIIDDEGVSDIIRNNGIVINPSKANEHATNYPITKFIQKYAPSARLLEEIGSEIIYVLPTDDVNTVKKFEFLFTELDRYMSRLKIRSYGLSDTTLEEIFLKVASNPHDGDINRRGVDPEAEFTHVANRVRSASECSGLRHHFGLKKRSISYETPEELGEMPDDFEPFLKFDQTFISSLT